MTHEEAIKQLTNVVIYHQGKCTREALDIAINAIKKQIPMKPLHEHKNYYCPICREDGWMLWDDAIPNDMDSFCGKCGQAIDWGVDE